MGRISISEYMSNESEKNITLPRFNYSEGNSVIGLSRKDNVNENKYFADKYKHEMTERERSSNVLKSRVWAFQRKQKDQSGIENPYSRDFLEEKVKNGEMETKLLTFMDLAYRSINDRPFYSKFRDYVRSDFDGFMTKNLSDIMKKYKDKIDAHFNRDKKGRFISYNAAWDNMPDEEKEMFEKWVMDEGYIYLAEDEYTKRVNLIRDAVLSCKTMEDAEKKFGFHDDFIGSFFVKNHICHNKVNSANQKSGFVSNEWSQYVNQQFVVAFERTKNGATIDKNKDSFTKKALAQYVPVTINPLRIVKLEGKKRILLVPDEDLRKFNVEELKDLRKKGQLVTLTSEHAYKFLNGIKGDYAVINADKGAVLAINLPCEGEAKALSLLSYKTDRLGGESFRFKFLLKELKREGIEYRPSGNGKEPVCPDDRKPNGSVNSIGDCTQQLGVWSVVFGNEVPVKEKQEHCNQIYDALRDLSNALLVDVKSLTHNIQIEVGNDGVKGALAHCKYADTQRGKHSFGTPYTNDNYERQSRINLTRFCGAGCLAHEFIHALDRNLADGVFGVGTPELSISRNLDKIDQNKYPNLYNLINGVTREDSEFLRLAKKLDDASISTEPYWSSPQELMARAGAVYIKDKLAEMGMKVSEKPWTNDYLCGLAEGVVSSGISSSGIVTSPRGEEREKFNKLFDAAISELKDLGIVKGISEPDFTTIKTLRLPEENRVERFVTGLTTTDTVPLIGSNLKSFSDKSVFDTAYFTPEKIKEALNEGNPILETSADDIAYTGVRVTDRVVLDELYSRQLLTNAAYRIVDGIAIKEKLEKPEEFRKNVESMLKDQIRNLEPMDFNNFVPTNISPELVNHQKPRLFGEI